MTASTPSFETKSSPDLNHALDDLLRAFDTYKEENDRRLADVAHTLRLAHVSAARSP